MGQTVERRVLSDEQGRERPLPVVTVELVERRQRGRFAFRVEAEEHAAIGCAAHRGGPVERAVGAHDEARVGAGAVAALEPMKHPQGGRRPVEVEAIERAEVAHAVARGRAIERAVIAPREGAHRAHDVGARIENLVPPRLAEGPGGAVDGHDGHTAPRCVDRRVQRPVASRQESRETGGGARRAVIPGDGEAVDVREIAAVTADAEGGAEAAVVVPGGAVERAVEPGQQRRDGVVGVLLPRAQEGVE